MTNNDDNNLCCIDAEKISLNTKSQSQTCIPFETTSTRYGICVNVKLSNVKVNVK